MKKILAIEHLRTLLAMIFGVFPVVIFAAWCLTWITSSPDDDPAAQTMISIALLVGLVLAMAIAVYLVFVMMRPQRYLEDLARLEAGDSWVEWGYDEEQWRASVAGESARQWRTTLTARVAVGLGAVLVVLGVLVGPAWELVMGGVITLLAAGAMVAAAWLTGSARFARDGRAGTVRISRLGVLRQPGGYAAFAPGGPLTGVELVTGERTRVLFTASARQRYGTYTENRTADILVPAGHEDEARALVERFTSEVVVTIER